MCMQVATTGAWNVTLMEASFDAIVNESTIFDTADPQMVLVRGYPGPVSTPFLQLPTDVSPGPGRRNVTITVPTLSQGALHVHCDKGRFHWG